MSQSYLDILKEGILNRDMEAIKRAYEGMSGTKIVERHGVSGVSESEYIARPNAKFAPLSDDGKPLARRVPTKIVNINQFKDTGDNGDKPLSGLQRISNKKSSAYFEDMKCNSCNKVFSVNKRHLPRSLRAHGGAAEVNTSYICDECISKRR